MAGTDCRLEVLRSGCWNMESCPGCSLPHFPDPPCCWPLITALTGHRADSCENYRKYRCCAALVAAHHRSHGCQVSLLAGPQHAGDWRPGRGAAAAVSCCAEKLRVTSTHTDRPPRRRRPPHSHSHEAGTHTEL